MRGNRKRDTRPELRVRRILHASGLRFRVGRALRVDGALIRPDIVFGPTKIAVFVHGCFWHHCPTHGNEPGGTNADYWSTKLSRNVERDAAQVHALEAEGWAVITVWEHDDPAVAARTIEHLVRARRAGSSLSSKAKP